MIDECKLWDDWYERCPWYNNGDCDGQVHYNGHVNDPRYEPCIKELCPVFFWISTLILSLNSN